MTAKKTRKKSARQKKPKQKLNEDGGNICPKHIEEKELRNSPPMEEEPVQSASELV